MKYEGATHGRGYVYSLQYHVVWCVKYRRKVRTGAVAERLLELLNNIARDNGFEIVESNTAEDHVHLLLSCKPQNYIPSFMKALKGVSARLLMKEFGPELRSRLWDGHLWNPRYFIAAVSDRIREQITAYIRSQQEK